MLPISQINYRHRLWTREHPEVSAENEVGDLLYGLIRLHKPKHLVETGTAYGATTMKLAHAVRDNEYGWLDTAEIDEELVAKARRLLVGLPVTVNAQTGINMLQELKGTIDFAFIDSGWMPVRLEEAMYLAESGKLSRGALVCFHDVCQNYGYPFDEFLKKTGARNITIESPYGLGIAQMGEADWSRRGVEIYWEGK